MADNEEKYNFTQYLITQMQIKKQKIEKDMETLKQNINKSTLYTKSFPFAIGIGVGCTPFVLMTGWFWLFLFFPIVGIIGGITTIIVSKQIKKMKSNLNTLKTEYDLITEREKYLIEDKFTLLDRIQEEKSEQRRIAKEKILVNNDKSTLISKMVETEIISENTTSLKENDNITSSASHGEDAVILNEKADVDGSNI